MLKASAIRIKKTDASKLQDEYAKLVEGLQEAASEEDAFMSNPGTYGSQGPENDIANMPTHALQFCRKIC